MNCNDSAVFFGKRYYLFLMVFLGALSAFGPFISDFYLPTLPSLASVFSTTPSMVQLGLTASMLGIAVGQLLVGPVSDKYGRRPLLVASLLLFSLASVAIIFSPPIEFFNVCRFLQGLGGSGGIVMSRSVATDCYSGQELAKTLAIVGTINGIAPVIAPLVGGMVANTVGWRGIFLILLVIGVGLLACCSRFRESLPRENRIAPAIVFNLYCCFRTCLRSAILLYIFRSLHSAESFRFFRNAVFYGFCRQCHRHGYRFRTDHAV